MVMYRKLENNNGSLGYLVVMYYVTSHMAVSAILTMEGNVLFNNTLNTFYLRVHDVRHGKRPVR